MATGRTLEKWTRFYVGGYDLSGFGRSIGPLLIEQDEADLTAWTDTVKGYLGNHVQCNLGMLNAIFDNTATTGLHAVLGTVPNNRTVIVAKGIRAEPAAGDPAFCGEFLQSAYRLEDDGGAVVASIPFSGWPADATSLLYAGPWGQLLHANGAETAANTGTGIDNYTGAFTTRGGYFVYQVLAGNGTATLSVDDSADNVAFLALSGATSGSVNCAVRSAGLVALGTDATVRQYLRWQLALGTATTVTFVSAFVRG